MEVRVYQFGPFELDRGSQLLRRSGREVALPRRSLAVLELFVRRAGELITRDEIVDEVWQGSAVSDGSVSEAVWALRQVLEDDPKQPRYVQTVHGRGYRFVASIEPVESTAQRSHAPIWRTLGAAAVVVLAAAVVVLASYLWRHAPSAGWANLARPRPTLSELVLPDGRSLYDNEATLSPDGMSLAFYDPETDSLSIYDIAERTIRPIVPARDGPMSGYRFSLDGRRLAYATDSHQSAALNVADRQTGETRRWFRESEGHLIPIDWSRDGRTVHALSWRRGRYVLLHIREDGAVDGETTLDGWDPRVSPSGGSIAYTSGAPPDIRLQDVETASVSTVASSASAERSPVWSHDEDWLAFLSDRTGEDSIWAVPMAEGRPSGEPVLVERGVGAGSRLVDWLADGTLVLHRNRRLRDVWVVPVDPGSGAQSGPAYITTDQRGENGQPDWSPDGRRILFRSTRNTNDGELYVADVSERREFRLDVEPGVMNAAWSPTGDTILYAYSEDAEMYLVAHAFRTGASRRLPIRLPSGRWVAPDFSPDGRQLLLNVHSEDPEKSGLYIATFERLVRRIPETSGGDVGRWSPDASHVAYVRDDAIWVARADTGERRLLVPAEAGVHLTSFVDWSPNGKHIVFPRGTMTRGGLEGSLWVATVETGARHALELEGPDVPWWVRWSPDGRHLAVASTTGHGGLFMLNPSPPLPGGKGLRAGVR